MKTARMLAPITLERVRSVDGTFPKTGDVVVLDQGFIFPDGRAGGLVCFLGPDGKVCWEAQAHDTELEPRDDA